MKSEQFNRTQTIWKVSLNSALRTVIACIIVGCITLYGPQVIRNQVAFPAFSYVVVVLIVTNATLGDTIRGCWQAIYATIQTIFPAMVCLSIVGPTKLNATSTSLVLGVAAFFIALPGWTHIVAKRIALGQLVIIYVVGYINGDETHAIMHPLNVASSTALGALACFFALLLPYPHLASSQVKLNSKLFAENVSERLKIYVKAFSSDDGVSSQALISQAKGLSLKARKFLHCIKARQESMNCERILMKFLRPYCENPGDRFQELETPIKGMEIALSDLPTSVPILDQTSKDGLNGIEAQICQNLDHLKSHMPCETSTVPDSNSGRVMDFLQTLQTPPLIENDLPSFFFLFCMKLLHSQSRAMTSPSSVPKNERPALEKKDQAQPNGLSLKTLLWASSPFTISKKRLIPALKCSLSLFLAVLLGLHYSKPNGFWAGLPVGISLAAAREATFKVTNVKFQGTVIGNVYGVLGCFIFERFVQVRFIALLPWFIFTSFLQQSKMYGQAGAISAAIGAVLILGRKNFGPPSDFAVARIVETFIGLSCAIMVELLLNPTRAVALSKHQLSKTLISLQVSLSSIDLVTMSKTELQAKVKRVKLEISELEKCVGEAEVEPSFWFIPFHHSSYSKLLTSTAKMADLLMFIAHAIGSIHEQIQRFEQKGCKDLLDKMNSDLKLVGKLTGSSVKSFQELTLLNSLVVLENELAKSGKSYDVELGKLSNSLLDMEQNDHGKLTKLFLDHLKEMCDKMQVCEDEIEAKNEMVMSLAAIGFCLNCLMKETQEVEKGMKELLQGENPKCQINLKEISCKIHALYN